MREWSGEEETDQIWNKREHVFEHKELGGKSYTPLRQGSMSKQWLERGVK